VKKTGLVLTLVLGLIFGAIVARKMSRSATSVPAPERVYLPVKSLPKGLLADQLKFVTDNYIYRQVAEGLFAIGNAFEIEPRLAESIHWSSDGKTVEIKIRSARFSDGTPITAHMVAQSLQHCVAMTERTLLVATRSIEGYDKFVGGKSPTLPGLREENDATVLIRLIQPAPLLLDDLAQAECHIIKPSPEGSYDLFRGAIGSGPYQIVSHGNTELSLQRNPHYYREVLGPREATFRVTSDFGDLERLKSWVTLAIVDGHVPPPENFEASESSDLAGHLLIFNHATAPFSNRELRRAVALAIDVWTLAHHMNWNPERLQQGLMPYGMQGFRRREPRELNANRAKARRLLAKQGYDNSHPLEFTVFLSDLPASRKEAEVWPLLFGDLPIRITPRLISYSEMAHRQETRNYDAMRIIKFAGSLEAHRLLASFLTGSRYNPTHSKEPRCDAMIQSALRTTDRENRQGEYLKADDCLLKAGFAVPLSSVSSGTVLLRRPWKLRRTNRYLLYPYFISEWARTAETRQ
jgi:ABC-type oligopeptide transport system substrate-binding subunit